MNQLTCGCEYIDSLILRFCELHKYPGPESHKDGKGIIIRDLENQIKALKEAAIAIQNEPKAGG